MLRIDLIDSGMELAGEQIRSVRCEMRFVRVAVIVFKKSPWHYKDDTPCVGQHTSTMVSFFFCLIIIIYGGALFNLFSYPP